MRLISVNISLAREIVHEGRRIRTGIFKTPVTGRVTVRQPGLEGDQQADLRVHGGPFMAVYAYDIESYRWWEEQLGVDAFPPGHFGENLTVEGMTDELVHVGDIFTIGDTVLQVTQPRLPCFKLGARMGDPGFPKRFLAAGRLGFYLRVLQEGTVGAGDAIVRTALDERRMTVHRIARLRKKDTHDLEGARQALDIESLSPTWREEFEERLADAGVSSDAG